MQFMQIKKNLKETSNTHHVMDLRSTDCTIQITDRSMTNDVSY